jgi:hypothetical protein
MDYGSLSEEIKQITEIAESVPERYKEKCFEILLQRLLSEKKSPSQALEIFSQGHPESIPSQDAKIPITTQIRLFMTKTGITEEELNSILFYDSNNDEVHFLKEPNPPAIAQGQIDWALLLALQKGVLSNELSVDAENVRAICQVKGFYDGANFASIFKKPKYASLFKAPITQKAGPQTLSDKGLTALATLIRKLAGRAD